MTDRNEQISAFAEKNGLTQAEATLVYGDGTEEDFAANYALLQEIKGGQSNDQNQNRMPADDPVKRTMELLQKADEAMKSGDVNKSIRLRRQAHGLK